mgnify:CR=1 FL=1
MEYKCAKQTTVAIVMKDGCFISMGTNNIMNPVFSCPRIEQGCKTGEGYNLCKEICEQKGHAEEVALTQYPQGVYKGATVYLIGHTYACKECIDLMRSSGINELIICDTGTHYLF